jgi:hypothetical protein
MAACGGGGGGVLRLLRCLWLSLVVQWLREHAIFGGGVTGGLYKRVMHKWVAVKNYC